MNLILVNKTYQSQTLVNLLEVEHHILVAWWMMKLYSGARFVIKGKIASSLISAINTCYINQNINQL